MRKLSLSEQLMHSTVRIECLENGQVISTGSGFLFNFLEKENGMSIRSLVTNKHVVKGAYTGRFILTLKDEKDLPTNKHYSMTIENFENSWIPHPDPQVDLCIMPIAPILHDMETKGLHAYYSSISGGLLPKQQDLSTLGALEDIVMIGYPNGLWDRVNNLPIMRKGVTATHPNRDYNGKKEFMIDAACYPGSSGSPVFLYNEGTFPDGNGGIVLGNRLLLLGVLYAGPQFTARGGIHIVDIPTKNTEVVLSSIPNNLGLIIKAEKLLDFEPILNRLSQTN